MRMRRILSTLATLALLTQPVIAPAQETTGQSMTAPGKAAFSQTVKETTTVVGIDPATRIITLKGSKGVSNLVAGEEVRNFDQLKVGDKVVAEYKQALSLDLKKGGGSVAGQTERESADRTPLGAKPGGSATREVTLVASVVAVDTRRQLVTLRGPKGNTVDLNVKDPDQLKNIKKGDQVQAVYTEAVVVSVEPASKK